MKDGFISVAAATPKVRVADCRFNTESILETIRVAQAQGVKILCLPELCVTAYTCADLFFQSSLLSAAEQSLEAILEETKDTDMLCAVGLPVRRGMKLYNCAAVIHAGQLLGIVPKQYLPGHGEYSESRHFASGTAAAESFIFAGQDTIFGTDLLFACETMPNLTVGIEISEDLWVINPPSARLAAAGASLILNPSAIDALVGKDEYFTSLVSVQSKRLICGYVCASCGDGESTTDLVFGAHNIIAENGAVLSESRYQGGVLRSEIDLERIAHDRMRITAFVSEGEEDFISVPFALEPAETELTRFVAPMPFVPDDLAKRDSRFAEILEIAALGLCKRLEHTHAKTAVVGLSGGLDSTLAILTTEKAMRMLSRPMTDIIAVTMPCFGTTNRTRSNAVILAERIGARLRTVNITESVLSHFRDIDQSPDNHDVTYENSQARERTQVLMDIANQENGMVIGTGDLSELALGWATYNGDHMSMYGVNASIPKTRIRRLVD